MATTIPERADRRNAYFVFVDETGFMLAPTLRRSWAPRGQTPVIHVSAPHERISGIGAMTISPKRTHYGFQFHLLADNANFQDFSVIQFIEAVRRKIRGPITLLWDQIPIHRTSRVNRYFAKHRRIVVEPLPPYAPGLNPVDYVWSYIKYGCIANYCPDSLVDLRRRVTFELSRLQRQPHLLKSLFARTELSLEPR
jgi:transposase